MCTMDAKRKSESALPSLRYKRIEILHGGHAYIIHFIKRGLRFCTIATIQILWWLFSTGERVTWTELETAEQEHTRCCSIHWEVRAIYCTYTIWVELIRPIELLMHVKLTTVTQTTECLHGMDVLGWQQP